MVLNRLKAILIGALIIFAITSHEAKAESCVNKLFSVTIDNSMSIGDALDNLAETCGLTVVVRDSGAKHKLNKKLYYVKLKNATLKSFLDTLLKDNDLNYTLRGNKLTISYLMTRTFKIHYVAGDRSGKSMANVTVAGDNGSGATKSSQGYGSSITITTDQKFQFWNTIKDEVHKILNTAGDGSIHFTKVGNEWIGPDGQKWEYNPLEPVVNPEAGLVTVTGTARQIQRVSKYIATLTKQIKTEVMIDVQILDVRMSNSKTRGIDWNKLYSTGIGFSGSLNSGGISDGITGSSFSASLSGDLTGFIKFLRSQGDLISVSSPKVMTLNNQPAMISVGKEIFYTTTSVTSANNGGSQNFQNQEISSVFAGILLDITPEVDERGMVTLKINPSISKEAVEVTNQANTVRTMPPDLIRRQMASVIKVRDGDHAILGGLITRSKEKTKSKVPLISSIPIVGKAFQRDDYTNVIDELVIIITPHIVKNGARGVSLKDLGYRNVK